MTVKIYAHGLPITAYIRIAYHLRWTHVGTLFTSAKRRKRREGKKKPRENSLLFRPYGPTAAANVRCQSK